MQMAWTAIRSSQASDAGTASGLTPVANSTAVNAANAAQRRMARAAERPRPNSRHAARSASTIGAP